MVEAAIILSVFLTLVLGMLDLSIGVFHQHVLSQAVRQGTRAAIVHGKLAPASMGTWGPAAYAGTGASGDAIANSIQPYLTGLDPSKVNITVTWLDASTDTENRVRVALSTDWTPIMLSLFGSKITLSSSSTMPIAH